LPRGGSTTEISATSAQKRVNTQRRTYAWLALPTIHQSVLFAQMSLRNRAMVPQLTANTPTPPSLVTLDKGLLGHPTNTPTPPSLITLDKHLLEFPSSLISNIQLQALIMDTACSPSKEGNSSLKHPGSTNTTTDAHLIQLALPCEAPWGNEHHHRHPPHPACSSLCVRPLRCWKHRWWCPI
jgi:hypothetical protein